MKAAFFIAFLFAGFMPEAQESQISTPVLKEKIIDDVRSANDTAIIGKMPNIWPLQPGTRVIQLPQDGMPCIVPDIRSIATMPNPGRKGQLFQRGRMPNVAPHMRMHPNEGGGIR